MVHRSYLNSSYFNSMYTRIVFNWNDKFIDKIAYIP